VPVVNENDVVAVEEIEGILIGDNDNLSALVTNLVDADLLVMLTDTGGLYTADPRRDADAKLIDRVERITPEIEALADDAGTPHGVGGMVTKLEAAKLATAGGADVVIASVRSLIDRKRRSISVRRPSATVIPTGASRTAMPIGAKSPAAPGSAPRAGESRAAATSAATKPNPPSRISSESRLRSVPRRARSMGQRSARRRDATVSRERLMGPCPTADRNPP